MMKSGGIVSPGFSPYTPQSEFEELKILDVETHIIES